MSLYAIPAQFGGTNGTTNMLMDTGSSWIWVRTCNQKMKKYTYCPNDFFNSDNS